MNNYIYVISIFTLVFSPLFTILSGFLQMGWIWIIWLSLSIYFGLIKERPSKLILLIVSVPLLITCYFLAGYFVY